MDLLPQIDRREMGKMMRTNLGFLWILRSPSPTSPRFLQAACGFPATKMRSYNWSKKAKHRKAPGTGRMSQGPQDAPGCPRMPQDAPGCPRMPQVSCLCAENHCDGRHQGSFWILLKDWSGLIIQVTQLSGMWSTLAAASRMASARSPHVLLIWQNGEAFDRVPRAEPHLLARSVSISGLGKLKDRDGQGASGFIFRNQGPSGDKWASEPWRWTRSSQWEKSKGVSVMLWLMHWCMWFFFRAARLGLNFELDTCNLTYSNM